MALGNLFHIKLIILVNWFGWSHQKYHICREKSSSGDFFFRIYQEATTDFQGDMATSEA